MAAAGKNAIERVIVRNVNHPGQATRVEKAKYEAMQKAMLAALPRTGRGLTFDEMVDAVKLCLPAAQFPGGAKAAWWTKTVQLDLEARSLVARDGSSPLRFKRTK